ncbi:hypothetical protein GDO78_011710 [Eleutherodactylus coqui]|uniref:Uncharacterized protein n=1 Tax=Eleutherodactylus coqui TaxID=57060 RepID=A0A8J6F3M7_ELECQ|nr:hypothetical protein GDO78_011710 [Eleutherodactylus coqui]
MSTSSNSLFSYLAYRPFGGCRWKLLTLSGLLGLAMILQQQFLRGRMISHEIVRYHQVSQPQRFPSCNLDIIITF